MVQMIPMPFPRGGNDLIRQLFANIFAKQTAFRVVSVAVVSLAMTASFDQTNPKPKRAKNVVFFLVDDLGLMDIAPYGSSFYETPNLDRLAKQSIKLTNGYAACPVCSPTRASLMTGKYPQRTSVTDYIGAVADPAKWKLNTKLLPAPFHEQLDLSFTTIAEVLKGSGYSTFFAGKWHLGPKGLWPENRGFDINMGGNDRGGPYGGDKYFSPYGNPTLSDGPPGEHLTARLADETSKFIRANQSKPFFALYSFYDVHSPHMARPDLLKKYQQKRARLGLKPKFGEEPPRDVRLTQDHAVYAGMVEAMDQGVGRVMDELKRLNLLDDTLVVFTSDNGGLSTSEGWPTSNSPLRGGKGWMYEGGIRVPLLIRLPGGKNGGSLCAYPASTIDFFPTILSFLGIRQKDKGIDGVDLNGVLEGRPGPDRALFWHYPHYGNQGGAPASAIRRGDWKLIQWYEERELALYDLKADPGEMTNLAQKQPERVRAMFAELEQWKKSTNSLTPTKNPNFDSSKQDGRVSKRGNGPD